LIRICRARWPHRATCATVVFLTLVLAGGCRQDTVAVTPPCGEAPTLGPGTAVTATLGRAGDLRRGGPYIHYYTLRPTQAARYRIEMRSTALDPFLYLFDETGAVVVQSFDRVAGGGPRSVVLEHVLEPGCHTVGASSWGAGSAGSYVLSVDIVNEAGARP
jgi:hypothetical protein